MGDQIGVGHRSRQSRDMFPARFQQVERAHMHEAVVQMSAFAPKVREVTNDLQTEINLAEEISDLWSAQVRAESTLKRTVAELREVRLNLGAKLHQMKQLLAKPGRNGGWARFLNTQNIPLLTADRYVKGHEATLNAANGNLSSEEIRPKSDVHALFDALWPRLQRVLRSQLKLYEFVCLLTTARGHSSRELRENGIFVFRSVLDNPAVRAFAEGRRSGGSLEVPTSAEEFPYMLEGCTEGESDEAGA